MSFVKIKRMVIVNHDEFYRHDFNKRFFPEKFYFAYLFSAVTLELTKNYKIDIERITKINILYNDYLISLKNRNIEKINNIQSIFRAIIHKDDRIINEFLNEYREVHIEESIESAGWDKPGRLTVSSDSWFYEGGE